MQIAHVKNGPSNSVKKVKIFISISLEIRLNFSFPSQPRKMMEGGAAALENGDDEGVTATTAWRAWTLLLCDRPTKVRQLLRPDDGRGRYCYRPVAQMVAKLSSEDEWDGEDEIFCHLFERTAAKLSSEIEWDGNEVIFCHLPELEILDRSSVNLP